MIECNMPQDILKYEAKFVGNFTMRQTIWGGAGIAVALTGWFLVFKNVNDTSLRIIYSALIALPFFLIGFVKIYGQPFEKFVGVFFWYNVLSPSKRPSITQFPEYEKWAKQRSFVPQDPMVSAYEFLLPEEEQRQKVVLTEKEAKQKQKEKRFRVKESPDFPQIF